MSALFCMILVVIFLLVGLGSLFRLRSRPRQRFALSRRTFVGADGWVGGGVGCAFTFTHWRKSQHKHSVCSSPSPRAGHGEQVVDPRGGTCVPVTCELRGTGAGSAVDVYLYGWNTGGAWGGGSGSLMILAGVLVHRAARPQRQSVFLVQV